MIIKIERHVNVVWCHRIKTLQNSYEIDPFTFSIAMACNLLVQCWLYSTVCFQTILADLNDSRRLTSLDLSWIGLNGTVSASTFTALGENGMKT